jgi:hypothetical protein
MPLATNVDKPLGKYGILSFSNHGTPISTAVEFSEPVFYLTVVLKVLMANSLLVVTFPKSDINIKDLSKKYITINLCSIKNPI